MRRLLRLVALLPIAIALALFVHTFTGEDHEVAGGHGAELGAALVLGGLAWAAWLAAEAFRGRRAGRTIRDVIASALPGGGRIGVVAAVLALEAGLGFAGIEASEGRLAQALHLDPLLSGGLFGLGGILFAGMARLLATVAAGIGAAVAESIVLDLVRIARPRRAPVRRPAYATVPVRLDRGRAPPLTIPR